MAEYRSAAGGFPRHVPKHGTLGSPARDADRVASSSGSPLVGGICRAVQGGADQAGGVLPSY